MIWNGLIDVIWNVLIFCLESFGVADVTWSVNSTFLTYFESIFRVFCYFFPIRTVVQIIQLIIAFTFFRIVIRFIKTLWDLLPIV